MKGGPWFVNLAGPEVMAYKWRPGPYVELEAIVGPFPSVLRARWFVFVSNLKDHFATW